MNTHGRRLRSLEAWLSGGRELRLPSEAGFFCFLIIYVYLCSSVISSASAQSLRGDWVERTEAEIEKYRKTDLRVIVLDENGDYVPGATVRIEQLRHAFPLGYAVGPEGLDRFDPDGPVLRCFNAVSLGRWTEWSRLQPEPGRRDLDALQPIIDAARERGLAVQWGGVVSADPAQNPDWVAALSGEILAAVLDAHVNSVIGGFGRDVQRFDLYTDAMSHDFVESRLGEQMVRRMYEQAQADAPGATLAVRYRDTLLGSRLREMVQHVTVMKREKFIPIERVAIEQRMNGTLMHSPLSRALSWLDRLNLDADVVGLEVGGDSEAAAAINLETLLRTLFANPHIDGITFAGLTGEAFTEPNAALLLTDGKPTPAGAILDGCFRELWWTDHEATVNELSHIETRVFPGEHHITVALPDGREVSTRVWIEASPEWRVVLVQPVK